MDGFFPAAPPLPFLWKSRKRPASSRSLENALKESLKTTTTQHEESMNVDITQQETADGHPQEHPKANLSDRRKALFEPLNPVNGGTNGRKTAAEDLLPPPDFDSTSYPKGWLVGKRRKLVNVDVVESMRRIAIQEMNRKDREIDGLNEQLEEDARCLEHLQLQLLQERSKRADVEREKSVLQNQISMLMNMLDETQAVEVEVEDEEEEEEEDAPGDS